MSKTQNQTQIHAHECSSFPPLFLVRCCVVVFVLLFCFCPFCLSVYVACSSLLSFFCLLCVICRFSCSSWRVFASQIVVVVLCCVCGSVLVFWVCVYVCMYVCMYVSVGYVCERLQVCWCTTHTLNTRHTHHTHHTHPHGRKGCVMCCIVQRCGKQQQTHNTTTHHHHHHHHHHKHITTQHDTQGEEGGGTHQLVRVCSHEHRGISTTRGEHRTPNEYRLLAFGRTGWTWVSRSQSQWC